MGFTRTYIHIHIQTNLIDLNDIYLNRDLL
jgi:hypothetical protein